jgi:hypothetical protein
MLHLGVMETGRAPVRLNRPAARRRPRARMADLPPLTAEQGTHLHYVQQMLIAAVLASGAIVTVAAVMILRLF